MLQKVGRFVSIDNWICYLTTLFSFLQLFLCSEFFSFSPCITRRQKFYFLPRLSNQENSVLQGNKVSYSIESWKWGIFRQRQLFCNRKIYSVLGGLISGQKCPPLPSWQHTVSWGKPVLHAGPPTTFSFSPCSRAFSLSTYTAFPWFYWIKERYCWCKVACGLQLAEIVLHPW